MEETILQVLMRRDKLSAEEAMDVIQEAVKDFEQSLIEDNFADPEDIIASHFGLEPDYIFDFFNHVENFR